MSTKASLAHGPKFHLYTEAWDAGAVFLQLDGIHFEASEKQMVVRIPVAIWEYIRTIRVAQFDLVLKSKVELEELARGIVLENRTHYDRFVGSLRGKRHLRNKALHFPRKGRSVAHVLAELQLRQRRQRRLLRAVVRLRKNDAGFATVTVQGATAGPRGRASATPS